MMGSELLRPVIVIGLLALIVSSAQAQAYNYASIDYPGADFTAGFTISPTGEIGGGFCAGPLCQGFLLQVGTSPLPVTPPVASGSYVTGIQRGGFLLSGTYSDANSNAHGYVWDLLHPSNFVPIDPDPNGVLDTEVADMNPAGNLAGWYSDLSGVGHGYVRIKNVLTSFDLPGAIYTTAYGISPGGDLVGTYCDVSICHAYLLPFVSARLPPRNE